MLNSEIFEQNIRALSKRDTALTEKIINTKFEKSELRESASLYNLYMKFNGGQGYLHFKDDPGLEAMQLIEKSRQTLTKPPRILFFYGMGLGFHILKYLTNPFKNNNFIVIIEKEPEIFRAALMINDFSHLFEQKNVHLFIGEPLESLKEKLISFWYKDSMFYMMNCLHNMIFEGSVNTSPEYYVEFSKAVNESMQFVFNSCGNSCTDAYIGVQNTISNLGVLIKNRNIEAFKDRFKGVPGFLVCSGPSLNQNLDRIKLLKNRGIVACCDSALKPVYEANGLAHFVTTIERGEILSEFYRNLSENIKSILISPPLLSEKVFENYNRSGLIILNKNNALDIVDTDYSSYYLGQTCSNLGMVALHILGCSPIILIGNDLSYNQKNGESHVSGGIANNDLNMNVEKPENVLTDIGNNGAMLKTKESWIRFRKSFEFIINFHNIDCYNVNDDKLGLNIKGTKVITFNELLNLFPEGRFEVEEAMNELSQPVKTEEIEKKAESIIAALENYKSFLFNNQKKINEGKKLLNEDTTVTDLKLDNILKLMESFWFDNTLFNGMLLDVIAPEHVPIMINLYELTGEDNTILERKFNLIKYWFSLLERWNQTLYILLSDFTEGGNFEKRK